MSVTRVQAGLIVKDPRVGYQVVTGFKGRPALGSVTRLQSPELVPGMYGYVPDMYSTIYYIAGTVLDSREYGRGKNSSHANCEQ